MARPILRGERCVFQAQRHHDRDLFRNVFCVSQCLVVGGCFSQCPAPRRVGTSLPRHHFSPLNSEAADAFSRPDAAEVPPTGSMTAGGGSVSYTHLTLPTIY